jgi:sulfur dioxygenase
MKQDLIFHQLFEKETSTYTYLLGDPETKEAVLIDPVVEMADRDEKLIQDLGLKLKYVLDTHVHADHITASGEIRKRTGAKVGISSAYDMSCPDLHLEDGQEIQFGKHIIKALHTPGHTGGCITFVSDKMVFTGDALLVRGCGRTDFQEGSSEVLFESVREKIFQLPEDYTVYPAHDYKGFTKTSIGMEKRLNPRLNLEITKEQFVEIMTNLKLAYPKKIQEAVPANLQCGLPFKSNILNTGFVDEVPTVTPEDLHTKLGHVKIIDVRGTDEFNNELGHIPNAELATLGPVLDERLHHHERSEEIVFVCRSGKRSAEATKLALHKGFEKVYNLQGGMLRWNELRFAFERDMGGS